MEQDFASDASTVKNYVASPQVATNTATVPLKNIICGFGGRYSVRPNTIQDPTGTLTKQVVLYVSYLIVRDAGTIAQPPSDVVTEQVPLPTKSIRDAWTGSSSAFEYMFDANEVATGIILNTLRINSASVLSNTTGFGMITRNVKTKEKKTYGVGDLAVTYRTKTFDTQTSVSALSEITTLTIMESTTQTIAWEVTNVKASVWDEFPVSSGDTEPPSDSPGTGSSAPPDGASPNVPAPNPPNVTPPSAPTPNVTPPAGTDINPPTGNLTDASPDTKVGQIIPGVSNTTFMIVMVVIIIGVILFSIIIYVRKKRPQGNQNNGTGRSVQASTPEQ